MTLTAVLQGRWYPAGPRWRPTLPALKQVHSSNQPQAAMGSSSVHHHHQHQHHPHSGHHPHNGTTRPIHSGFCTVSFTSSTPLCMACFQSYAADQLVTATGEEDQGNELHLQEAEGVAWVYVAQLQTSSRSWCSDQTPAVAGPDPHCQVAETDAVGLVSIRSRAQIPLMAIVTVARPTTTGACIRPPQPPSLQPLLV